MLTLFKALADETRLRLISILFRSEFTVQELTRILSMGQSRVSRHLKILLDSGVVRVKRQGTWSYYSLAGGNDLFVELLPSLEKRFDGLESWQGDLEGVTQVLEARRHRSQAFFDGHARQWDELAKALLPLPDYRQQLLDLVPPKVTLVEAGIGTGRLLHRLTGRGGRVIGVDRSPAMLDEARSYLASVGETAVDLRLGEMEHLPLAENEAGCVILNMVLHHAAAPPAVFREIGRILQPGGRLILADLARHHQEWVREKMADQWLGFEPAELEDWLGQAGFGSCRFLPVARDEGQYEVLLLEAARTDDENQA